jgi:hypothetical protein
VAGLDADTARNLTPAVQRRVLGSYAGLGLLTRDEADDMLRWRGTGGSSHDGSVRVAAHDRAGLERPLLCCARPPWALHRLRHATLKMSSNRDRRFEALAFKARAPDHIDLVRVPKTPLGASATIVEPHPSSEGEPGWSGTA